MDNLVCCVAIAKHENDFIDEWLIYHKNIIGINHFFIYDDDEKLPLKNLLEYHKEYSTVINWSNIKNNNNYKELNQYNAYNHALNNYCQKYKWVIFIDIDEFFVLNNHLNIDLFLKDYFIYDTIQLSWYVFGHNGYYDNPNNLITSSLTKRKKDILDKYKSITKVNSIFDIESAHRCVLKKYFKRIINPNDIYSNGNKIKNINDIAHINHYQYRSFKNWMDRANRGDVNFNSGNTSDINNKEHLWRLTEENLLRHFVETCKDKNEITDDFMLKYKDILEEELEKVKNYRLIKT